MEGPNNISALNIIKKLPPLYVSIYRLGVRWGHPQMLQCAQVFCSNGLSHHLHQNLLLGKPSIFEASFIKQPVY